MRGIRAATVLLTVVMGPSFSAAMAPGGGASQPVASTVVETRLSLDGIPMGPLLESTQTQTAAGFEEKFAFLPQVMAPAFYTTWITPTLLGQRPMKTVRLRGVNHNGGTVSNIEATGIFPQKIEFPLLDATRHDPLLIKASFTTPRFNQIMTPTLNSPPPTNAQTLRLTTSSFRLQIPGLDASHVSKIESISVTPRSANPSVDPRRPPISTPPNGKDPLSVKTVPPILGPLSISNLVFYLPQASAQPLQQWLATAPSQTRSGSIDYLSQDMRTVWGTLSLQGLGITRITTESTPGPYGIYRTKVEMTIGGVQLAVRP